MFFFFLLILFFILVFLRHSEFVTLTNINMYLGFLFFFLFFFGRKGLYWLFNFDDSYFDLLFFVLSHSCKRNEYVINVLREYFIVFPRRVLYNWNNLHYKPIFLKGDQQNLTLLTQPKKKRQIQKIICQHSCVLRVRLPSFNSHVQLLHQLYNLTNSPSL